MPLVTHFCGVCGCRVPPDDLEVGRAVILNHVTYCRECAAKAGIEVDSPRIPTVRPVAGPPASRTTPRTSHRSEVRSSPRPAARTSRARRGGSGAMVGACLVVLALFLVAVALVLSRRDTTPAGNAGEVAEGPGPMVSSDPLPLDEPEIPERVPRPDRSVDPEKEAFRKRVRGAYTKLEDEAHGAGPSIQALVETRDRLSRGAKDLGELVRQAPTADDVVTGYVTRAESLAESVGKQAEEKAAGLYGERRSAVEAFVATRNFERALRELEGFPPGFERTTFGDRVKEDIARVEKARETYLREKAARRDEGWTYLFSGTALDGWKKRGNAGWSLATDSLDRKFLTVTNIGPGTATLGFAAPGSSAWADYKLRVDLRGVTGDLVVHVRGPMGASGATAIRVPAKLIPKTDDWWTMQIVSEGDVCRLFLNARRVHEIRKPAGVRGGLGFQLEASSTLNIKDVRAKLVP